MYCRGAVATTVKMVVFFKDKNTLYVYYWMNEPMAENFRINCD